MIFYRVEFIIAMGDDFVPDSSGDEPFTFAQMGELMKGYDFRYGTVKAINLGEYTRISKRVFKTYKDGGKHSHFTKEGGI